MSKLTAAKRVAIGDYNYPLPEERIAKHPLADRSACKLLVPGKSGCADYLFSDLPRLLPSDALLVRNTSKALLPITGGAVLLRPCSCRYRPNYVEVPHR